jgi:hypothetical protein
MVAFGCHLSSVAFLLRAHAHTRQLASLGKLRTPRINDLGAAHRLQPGHATRSADTRQIQEENNTMKKLLMGLTAALALGAFTLPARADDPPADGAKAEKPAKKGKKKPKKDKDAGDAPADGAAKK